MVWGKRPSSIFERDILSFSGISPMPAVQSPSALQNNDISQESAAYPTANLTIGSQSRRVVIQSSSQAGTTTRSLDQNPNQDLNHTRKYIELCVDHRRYEIHHAEVDVSQEIATNHDFFQKLKEAYLKIHKRKWFFKPNSVRFVEVG